MSSLMRDRLNDNLLDTIDRVLSRLDTVEAHLISLPQMGGIINNLLDDKYAAISLVALPVSFREVRGAWPMSAYDTASDFVGDVTGIGHQMAVIGNPSPDTWGRIGVIDLASASSQRLRIIDAAWNSITGNLTIGGWFYFDADATANESIASKWTVSGNQKSWRLYRNSSGVPHFVVSSDGSTNDIDLASSKTVLGGGWYFIGAVYNASTNCQIIVNTSVDSTTTSIPASLFDSNSDLEIGAIGSGGSEFIDGSCASFFICASAIGQQLLVEYYRTTRELFV